MQRPRSLTVLTVVFLFNALLTAIHYALIFAGVIPVSDDMMTMVREFTVADIVAVVIPSLVGAYGLLRFKAWGWAAAMLVCGGYLHGLVGLLTGAALTNELNMMSAVSVYIILFSVGFVAYLWRQRSRFVWV
ncbi:MAG: hypothetical protein HY779_05840 [Rubrobacteridae bacterium]|nr:hypothetical protein [Rubrobacteridae bacterium]